MDSIEVMAVLIASYFFGRNIKCNILFLTTVIGNKYSILLLNDYYKFQNSDAMPKTHMGYYSLQMMRSIRIVDL